MKIFALIINTINPNIEYYLSNTCKYFKVFVPLHHGNGAIIKTKPMKDNKKITAKLEVLDIMTDVTISSRFVGEFSTRDEASFAAEKLRQPGETVCLYNCPADEEEELSAYEMAEQEVMWDLLTK